jgi:hypothetical protein
MSPIGRRADGWDMSSTPPPSSGRIVTVNGTVQHGGTVLGRIVRAGGTFTATDRDGVLVGTYPNPTQARDAIAARYGRTA